MTRGVGEFEPLRELLPPAIVALFALVTQLGDVWFLSTVLVVTYWTQADRRDGVATVVGVTLTGFAVITALKRAFALPRPPASASTVSAESLPAVLRLLYDTAGTASGYGFPSGHAFMTTVVYLSLVDVLDVGSRRRRLLAAAGLVAVVCTSRVVLAVHYLVDVVAGVALGVVVLAFARWLVRRHPTDDATIAFGLAVVASGINLVLGPGDPHTVVLFGATLGAFAGWQLVVCGRIVATLRRPSLVPRELYARGALTTAAIALLVGALDEVALTTPIAGGAVLGLFVAALMTVPVLRHSEHARGARAAIAFWARQVGPAIRHLASPARWRRAASAGLRAVRAALGWLRSRLEKR